MQYKIASKRSYRFIATLCFALAGTLFLAGLQIAADAAPGALDPTFSGFKDDGKSALAPASGAQPISSLLNSDGLIKRGISGNFDPKGFRMVAGADGKPRFLTDTSSRTSQLAKPSRASQLVADCVDGWDDRFGAGGNGLNGFVFAIAVSGTNVYVGGSFTVAGGVSANRIAMWDGSSWSSVGSGMNATVRALAVSGTDVYAAGDFTMAGGGSANRIAKWNGASWSALGSGINGPVHALAVSGNGDVYAAGDFTTAGGFSANRIAKWNGSSWSSFGSGMIGTLNGTPPRVFGIAVSGNDEVYAGGYFTTAGGVPANSLAKWDGSSWSSLTSGLGGAVHDISISASGDVYVSGDFNLQDGISAHDLAKWNGDGSGWSALGSGVGGSNMWVFAVVVSGNDVYAGGHFTNAGGRPANNIAIWNGSGWSEFAAGAGDGSNAVFAAAASGNDLYVGGSFSTAGCHEARYFSRYDLTVPPGPAPTPPPVTITVTNTNDSGAGSLRQAIADVTPGSTINFDTSVFATPQTIALTSGELFIDTNVTIQGPGANLLSVSGNNASRVFYTDWDITATLDGMTIKDGSADDGAGLTNGGVMTVSNSTISDNSATYRSGGIRNWGTLSLINSAVSGNTAAYADGGFGNGGTMTLTNSIILDNTAGGGGGIWNGGRLTITNSTMSDNRAVGVIGDSSIYDFKGGAIYNEGGVLTINNSTISGNTATDGGGIFSTYNWDSESGTVLLTNSTMSNNEGGGIVSDSSDETLRNTIVSDNAASGSAADISGTIETASHNLIGDAASSGGILNGVNGNIVGVNSLLGPLQNNGGATFTHALLPGSPAVNAGDNCVLTEDGCGDGNRALLTDQRGMPRNGFVDIGAFEMQADLVEVSISGRVTTANGRGFGNAVVTMVDPLGVRRTTRTSTFGYYSFTVFPGDMYTISVKSKQIQFQTQTVFAGESLSGIDFISFN